MAPERKPILPRFTTEVGEDEPQALRRMAHEGLDRRLAAMQATGSKVDAERAKAYRDRLDYELDVIVKMGFPGYFLIVADFIQWAKRHGIPVGPGRGSGAGSVVAWALTITDLDPLRFGLLFERFLNPERVSMPDFDIDFCQDRRDEVIRYVQQRYGADRVAQIITFGTLQARAAIRDCGRVLEMPLGQVDRIAKMVPMNPANPVTLAKALESEPRLRYEQENDENVARLIDTAMKLEGLHRHASTHAAGVVIGDRPLTELVPLYRDPRSTLPATQFNMKWVEPAGLVKFDFLGLKTLTVLERTVRLLKKRGIEIDLGHLPLENRASFDLLSRGDTVGIFQLESQGMRDVVRNLKPDRLEDIVALVALYRPGPMENIPRFINCKHGREEPDYLHPLLEPVLTETYGVIVYQEQVMQIAQILAGYSLGEADLLRRAMGKKIKAEMEAQRERFVKGAQARDIPADQATFIFDLVDKFAGYGFNKSHAAAYALVAYQTAYLKANHPVEFLAATMSLDISNTDKLGNFRQELRRLGIDLLPPDVNNSEVEFSVELQANGKGAVRYALAAIRNVGMAAVEGLVAERAKGPFRALADFARRMDPQSLNKRMVENLARAGAFDGLDRNRRRVSEAADVIVRQAQAAAEARESKQESLFGCSAAAEPPLTLPTVHDWDDLQRLEQEFSAIGFYLSAHPLDGYARSLKKLAVMRYADLVRGLVDRPAQAKIAGIVMSRQERTSQRGSRFAYVQLSDPSGTFEVLVFAEALTNAREHLETGKAVILTVEARPDGESARLSAKSVEPLENVADTAADGVVVHIRDVAPVGGVRAVLDRVRKQGGRGRVSLMLRLPDDGSEVEILLPGGYPVTRDVRAALKQVNGVDLVEER
jgi:DNA polymerase-3 subunit alpha